MPSIVGRFPAPGLGMNGWVHTGGGKLADWLGPTLTLGRVFRLEREAQQSAKVIHRPQARPGTNRERPATEPRRPTPGIVNTRRLEELLRGADAGEIDPVHEAETVILHTRRPCHVLRVF